MKLPSSYLVLALAAMGGLRAGEAPVVAAKPGAGPVLDVSLGASAGFDSNVYLADRGRLANRESAVGGATARLGAKWSSGVALACGIAATKFAEEPREDHVKHALTASWAGRAEGWSWGASGEFTLVDGDDRGVDYGAGVGSAFSTAAPRERRDQWQNKTDLSLRREFGAGFVRAVGKLQYWDMRTAPVNGCDYVDRHETQGGADLGRALARGGPEGYVGYRRGYQYQDNDFAPATLANASNHFDRYLVGLDGAPTKAWKVAAQAGWAVHRYDADYAGRAREEGLFTDVTLTWKATTADEWQLKTCQGRTISTTGKNSILLTTHQLSWKRTLAARWTATLGGRVVEAEYAPFARDDLDFAAFATLAWNVSKNLSCTLTASQDRGRNHLDQLSGEAEARREFDRTFVSAGVTWTR